ncbi:Two-component response regulator ARR14 [Platanthera zijinensis]|uniref:Two-component response regulator ARR14 n=1 Tax=Platanthera zijinensis TaxID=2320716 RepID=A0AAP0B244_9ASPA
MREVGHFTLEIIGFCTAEEKFCNERAEEHMAEIEFSDQELCDPAAAKKARVIWSVDLHQKFVNAVDQIGLHSDEARFEHKVPLTSSWHSSSINEWAPKQCVRLRTNKLHCLKWKRGGRQGNNPPPHRSSSTPLFVG